MISKLLNMCNILAFAAICVMFGCNNKAGRIYIYVRNMDGVLVERTDAGECVLSDKNYFVGVSTVDDNYYAFVVPEANTNAEKVLVIIETNRDNIQIWKKDIRDKIITNTTGISKVTMVGSNKDICIVNLHYNPSCEVALIVPRHGGIIQYYYGHHFTWNEEKRDMAYVKESPHFGSPENKPAQVMAGNVCIGYVPSGVVVDVVWIDGCVLVSYEQNGQCYQRKFVVNYR